MALDAPRHPFLNRVDLRFTTDDINVPPRRFHYRRLDRRLQVGDIDGTAPGRQHRPRWPRCVDPLDPVYQLASFVHEPPEPMRFTRDTLDISDIEGTRTTVPIVLRMRTRDHINYDDVMGSVAAYGQAKRAARSIRPIMMVADINDSGRFRSRRHTDPLSPRYVLHGAEASGLSAMASAAGGGASVVVLGDIPGSRPKRMRSRPLPTFALATRDIDGNKPMWRVQQQQRLAVRDTNTTADIEGAQADTAGRWHWRRRTNPLAPDYQLLDRGDPSLNPLAAPNIGLDLHQLYLDTEHNRLPSDDDDDGGGGGDGDDEGENRARSDDQERTAMTAIPVPDRRTRPTKLMMIPIKMESGSTITCSKGSGSSTTKSSRSETSSKKALSQRELRELQEKAQDQALVKALPVL